MQFLSFTASYLAALFRRGIHRWVAQDDRTEETLGAGALLQRAPSSCDAHETVQHRNETAAAERRKQVDPKPKTRNQGCRRSLDGQVIGSARCAETRRRAIMSAGVINRIFRCKSWNIHFSDLSCMV